MVLCLEKEARRAAAGRCNLEEKLWLHEIGVLALLINIAIHNTSSQHTAYTAKCITNVANYIIIATFSPTYWGVAPSIINCIEK